MRHDTPHPRELKARHNKLLVSKSKNIDGHVVAHEEVMPFDALHFFFPFVNKKEASGNWNKKNICNISLKMLFLNLAQHKILLSVITKFLLIIIFINFFKCFN